MVALALAGVAALAAQEFHGTQPASIEPPATIEVKAGAEVAVPLTIRIRPRYHINSNQPRESYLIPTKITWDEDALETVAIKYPEAEMVTYEFSEEPLAVYSGKIEIVSTLKAPASLPANLTELKGKLRYQACTDKACLPPKTLEVVVPIRR